MLLLIKTRELLRFRERTSVCMWSK
jgi:hypothetical protein